VLLSEFQRRVVESLTKQLEKSLVAYNSVINQTKELELRLRQTEELKQQLLVEKVGWSEEKKKLLEKMTQLEKENAALLTESQRLKESQKALELEKTTWLEQNKTRKVDPTLSVEQLIAMEAEFKSLIKEIRKIKDEKLQKLASETTNKKSEEENFCVVCMERPKSMVFVPCGHLCACEKCAESLKQCPICRQDGKTIKTFKV